MKIGFQAVKDSLDRAKTKGSGGSWMNYLTWKDGDRHIVRFLTDDIITCSFYEFVECGDGKKHDFIAGNTLDPNMPDYAARYNPMTRERGANGPLVPAVPRERVVGMVALREEQPDKSIVDAIGVKEVNGKDLPFVEYRIIRQGPKNFWSTLVGYHSRYNTICDRDYEITRRGERLDTTYQIIPMDPVDDLRDPAQVRERYGYGKERPEGDQGEDRFLWVPMTLKEWCLQQASEDRAKRWLGDGQEAATGSWESDSSGEPSPERAVSPGGTQFAASLRERLANR